MQDNYHIAEKSWRTFKIKNSLYIDLFCVIISKCVNSNFIIRLNCNIVYHGGWRFCFCSGNHFVRSKKLSGSLESLEVLNSKP